MTERSVPASPDDGPSRESPLVDAAWGQFAAVLSPGSSAPRGPLAIDIVPDVFPGYQVLGELHRGGQGVVYLAMQESTRRKVAIKVLRHGPFSSAADLARFEREVDLLARLRHPGIVAVHDRGIAAGPPTSPFLVMDYVAGQALDAFITTTAPDVRATLELFGKICDAVHAAHLVGIIHRDLKPANIRVDETGEPRILDFGLAKLDATADDAAGPASGLTESGQFVGSLPWASPEQAEGCHDAIDIRTDVYSLGVILFFMLTGELPYPRARTTRELAAHIASADPVRPSTVRRGVGADVETIILKCLAKEPQRRYQSAGELARDVANALDGRPIDARRDSASYILRKTLRRHWPAATTAAAFVLLLAGTAITSTVLYRRASVAQVAAQHRLEDARHQMLKAAALGRILGSLLTSMSPWTGASATNAHVLESLLDEARARADAELGDQPPFPEVRAELDEVLGSGYLGLGNFARAQEHLERCLQLRVELLGDAHADIATVRALLARLRHAQGRLEEAEALARNVLAWQEASLGADHQTTAATLAILAELRLDAADFEQAEEFARRSIAAYTGELGDSSPSLVRVYHTLGILLRVVGRLAESQEVLSEALRISLATLPASHPLVAASHTHLGALFAVRFDNETAEHHLREALRIRRATYDGTHPETAVTLTNLAAVLNQRGKFAEAEPIAREAISMYRDGASPDGAPSAGSLANLAGALLGMGDFDGAADAFAEVLALSRGRDERRAASMMSSIAQVRKAQGNFEAAHAGESEALALRRALFGDVHLEVAHSLNNLGDTLLQRGDPEGAVVALLEAVAIYRELAGEGNVLVGLGNGNLGRALLALHPDGAEALPRLQESVAILAAADPPHSRRLILYRCQLAEALTRQGRFDEAEACLLAAEAPLAGTQAAADHAAVVKRLVRLYDAWQRPEAASLWRERLPADPAP